MSTDLRSCPRTDGTTAEIDFTAPGIGNRGGVLVAKQAASFIGYSPKTLANWRVLGVGPRWLQGQAKGKVLYAIADLESWLTSRMRTSTSDMGGRRGE